MSVNKQLNMQISNDEEILEPLRKLNLLDDFLFDVATVDLETCKIILELSLGIRIQKLSWREGQKVVHNLPGYRGIRMDFYAVAEDGTVFDVESNLVDFLNYIENSEDESISECCDERLKNLHNKIRQIKSSVQIGVEYMKMEERDRLIREEAMQQGLAQGQSQGETRMAKLVLELTQKQRFSDLERATLDEEYRRKLFKEFGI